MRVLPEIAPWEEGKQRGRVCMRRRRELDEATKGEGAKRKWQKQKHR